MRHRETLPRRGTNELLTKDAVFVTVILAIAAVASIVGLVLAILGFLDGDDRSKPEGPWRDPPPIEQLKKGH